MENDKEIEKAKREIKLQVIFKLDAEWAKMGTRLNGAEDIITCTEHARKKVEFVFQ